jgi:6-pyruvoyltetrahydropterin/6-carboxytetrahydropterin synthase
MPRITRRFEFDTAHKVLGHEGKCANLHGHRYRAEVTVDAPMLDSLGRVIDFSEIKRVLGGWVDEHWDHATILHYDDPLSTFYADLHPDDRRRFFGPKPLVRLHCNPTAENLANVLYDLAKNQLPQDLKIHRVRLYETPNCWADYPDR